MIQGPDTDLTVTLPWPTICRLACVARIKQGKYNDD